MLQLLFLPLDAQVLDHRRRPLQVIHRQETPRTVRLLYSPDGGLAYADVSIEGEHGVVAPNGLDLAGYLHYARSGTGESGGMWYLVCSSPSVTIDSYTPPLSLTALEAGCVFSIGGHAWLVAHVWAARAMDVPPRYQDETCPVCGGPLTLAPVVRCFCGRLLHLQVAAGEDREAGDVLDCFLKAGDCSCGIEATLAPQILPVRARRLFQECDAHPATIGSPWS